MAVLALALLVLLASASPATAAGRRTPTLAPTNTVIDGPSSDIVGLSGLAIGRDGTGGLVYLKNVGGGAHVFVSALLGGRFQAPVQVDAGLSGSSSQPVIAATSGGLMLVAFVNAGGLYAAQKPGDSASWQAPQALFSGAANPSLSMSTFGKAYLAFTTSGAGAHTVRTAYFDKVQWALESSPLNTDPTQDAGTGTGRPQVATAGDGVGIVAWGEGGHIYTRRVWGTLPSVVDERADPSSFSGFSEASADQPQIATGGDSSYAAVAFHEALTEGSTQQSRVLVNRLHASQYDGASGGDGLTSPGTEGADRPHVVATEYGRGFVTSVTDHSDNLVATVLSTNERIENSVVVNRMSDSGPPVAVPAAAGLVSTLIAFQQDPGSLGLPEIRLRYAADGADLGSEQVVSAPSLGPTDAGLGLAAGGDLAGDAAIAWVQGSAGLNQIVTGQLFQTPGAFAPLTPFQYSDTVNPVLAWSPSSELWGAPSYTVKLDGVQIAQTSATAIRTPEAVGQGRHVWQVTAVNQAGLSTAATPAVVFVDTVAPTAQLQLTGAAYVSSVLHLYVSYADSPGAPSTASGVSTVEVQWGDGATATITHRASHVYGRRGTYVVKVIVRDRAGNQTVQSRQVRIVPRPKPKPKRKPKRRAKR